MNPPFSSGPQRHRMFKQHWFALMTRLVFDVGLIGLLSVILVWITHSGQHPLIIGSVLLLWLIAALYCVYRIIGWRVFTIVVGHDRIEVQRLWKLGIAHTNFFLDGCVVRFERRPWDFVLGTGTMIIDRHNHRSAYPLVAQIAQLRDLLALLHEQSRYRAASPVTSTWAGQQHATVESPQLRERSVNEYPTGGERLLPMHRNSNHAHRQPIGEQDHSA